MAELQPVLHLSFKAQIPRLRSLFQPRVHRLVGDLAGQPVERAFPVARCAAMGFGLGGDDVGEGLARSFVPLLCGGVSELAAHHAILADEHRVAFLKRTVLSDNR